MSMLKKGSTIDSPVLGNKERSGNRRTKDYHLALDMAKDLSIVERQRATLISHALRLDGIANRDTIGQMANQIRTILGDRGIRSADSIRGTQEQPDSDCQDQRG
jgi:phage anti-repressor protein